MILFNPYYTQTNNQNFKFENFEISQNSFMNSYNILFFSLAII